MRTVHNREIIHRDLSPNNIFILNGQLKIADFGLGKDLSVLHSHQTFLTNSVGQYLYCAPEQFMLLRDANKQSDIFSIGRIINFIMTSDPNNYCHMFRSVTEKATSEASFRFGDIEQLSKSIEKSLRYHQQQDIERNVTMKIANKQYDADVENYIYECSENKISQLLLERQAGWAEILLIFMKNGDNNAQHIIHAIDNSYQGVCGRSFAAYDPFAEFAFAVLKESFSFIVKEMAANILRFVAKDVNRFNAQHLVCEILNFGVEPMIAEILDF